MGELGLVALPTFPHVPVPWLDLSPRATRTAQRLSRSLLCSQEAEKQIQRTGTSRSHTVAVFTMSLPGKVEVADQSSVGLPRLQNSEAWKLLLAIIQRSFRESWSIFPYLGHFKTN